RELKKHLLAAMTLAAPGLRIEDEDGAVATLRAALARAPEDTQHKLRELVERVTRQKTIINLSRWSRGLERTADRYALLCAGDLVATAAIARRAGTPDAAIDLIDFALSDDFQEVSRALAG